HRSVASLPSAEILHGSKQILTAEIRPELLGYVHLGVGELPQQKIRNAHFTRGAYEQIRIWIIACVKMFTEHRRVDHGSMNVSRLDLAQQTAYAVDDFVTTAIA